MINSFFASALF